MGVLDWLLQGRHQRDAQAAHDLQQVRNGLSGQQHLLRVDNADRPFRRGTRAYVTFDDGTRADAFFWHRTVSNGQMLIVSGGMGQAYQRSESCFYVNEVLGALPADTWRRARRHRKRVRRLGAASGPTPMRPA